ncbi:MAG TPA: hypothetical protein VF246_06905 [Acidimicrobiia bacterium]
MKPESAPEIVESVWQSAPDAVELDEDCSPSKVCRNMAYVTFEGFAEEGDPATAWRSVLEREGKLDPEAGSLADLVFGESRQ